MEETLKTESNNRTQANILGYEKIGKLLTMYAIPSVISILVNALYNIVDQIFIGQGVGYLGNGATNIVFPITVVFASIALMLGDGSAAYLSLKLGAGDKKEASNGVANGIILSVGISVVLTAAALIFLPQLLYLFGCTPNLESYARGYGYIVVVGLPFMTIGTTVNSIIRADGNPRYAMMTMMVGAALNIVLDPIFIFVLNWGVKGAAIATAISQVVSFILNVIYIRKLKSVNLKRMFKEGFKFHMSLAIKVASLGISSFITQISVAITTGLLNNLLKKYGAESVYGSEIPITVIGIVMKVTEILNSIVLGLAMGSQPIIGFNYGAQKYDRVKKTLKAVIFIGLIISVIAFAVFQLIPDKIISIFGGSDDPNYIEFAKLSFRIYTALVIVNGFQTPVGIFFQAIGKSGKGALLSMSRQILFLVPSLLLLGYLFGLNGVVAARSTADGLAFLLSLIFLVFELRTFGKETS